MALKTMLLNGLLIVQAVSAVLTIALVLLHSPKSDGVSIMGGTSGGLMGSQQGAEATLNKLTYTVVGVFFASSFVVGYYF
jgi:preprotein translocase subunit SecG